MAVEQIRKITPADSQNRIFAKEPIIQQITTNNMKKNLLFAALMLLAMAINYKAVADDFPYTYNGQTLYYRISGSDAVVAWPDDRWMSSQRPTGDLVIPSTVVHEGIVYNVTAIEGFALDGCTELRSVVIPGSILSIGQYAFSRSGLTNVTIGDGVNTIGLSAFERCDQLESVNIPGSVSSIGERAFALCSGLTSVSIENGVDSILANAFGECGIQSIEIPHSVKHMVSAFSSCTDLTSAIIRCPNTGYNTFSDCSNLSSVLLGDSVTVIGKYTFDDCTSLTNITLPASVDTIDFYAFSDCPLSSIIIPASVSYMDSPWGMWGSSLDTIFMLGSVPPAGNPDFAYRLPTIVPCNSGSAYIESEYWRYNNIIDTCATLTIINNGGGYIIYDIDNGHYDYNEVNDTAVLISQGAVIYIFSSINNYLEFGFPPKMLTHLYMDNVDYIDSLTRWYYMAYGYIEYVDTITVPPSHVIEAVFEDIGQVTVLSSDTTLGNVSGGGIYLLGVETTISALPHGGSTFDGWSNGSMDNPLTITVTSDTTITALFSAGGIAVHDTVQIHDTTQIHDTVTNTIYDTTVVYNTDTLWLTQTDTIYITLYDTIYVHDTIVVGVDEVEAINAKIYSNNGQIVVDGADGNSVVLYDAVGRRMAVKRDEYSTMRFDIPTTGAYLVKVGNAPARRIVVVK